MTLSRHVRMWVAGLAVAVLIAACGDSDSSDDTGQGTDDQTTQADGGTGDGGSGGGTSGSGTDAGSGDGSGTGQDDEPDDDDAAEIIGQPDLDTDELPDEVAEALDEIDDIVSIGDCSSEVVGLALSPPDGWRCRVLDEALGGLDGFTMFTDGNELNVTIGTPSPLGAPCEILNACGDAEPVSLSANFPDTMQVDLFGAITIWGTYKDSDMELVITDLDGITEAELDVIRQALDSVVPFP